MSSVDSDQGGKFKTLSSDGPIEAIAQIKGGMRQHYVGLAQDRSPLVQLLRRRRVQDCPVPLRDHSLFLGKPHLITFKIKGAVHKLDSQNCWNSQEMVIPNLDNIKQILTLCHTKTLWMTAPPQNTIPRPMTTDVTIAGVSLKWRKVKRTIPGKRDSVKNQLFLYNK